MPHRIVWALVFVALAAAAHADTLIVRHSPGAGEYGSIGAALAAATDNDTIRIADNSAPYNEVVVVTQANLTLEGLTGLTPRPTIIGPENTSPWDPGLKTAFTYSGAGFTCRNLIIETDPANNTVVDARFGADAVFENVLMDAPLNSLNAYRSQQAATLTDCELRGGLYCLEMYFGGPLLFQDCSIGADSGINGAYISGGEVIFRDSSIETRNGISSLRLRTAIENVDTIVTLERSIVLDAQYGTSAGNLIEIEPGGFPNQAKSVTIDNCDLFGRPDRGAAVLYGGAATINLTDSIIVNSIGAVFEGIVASGDPAGYVLNEDYCAYKHCPSLNPALLGPNSIILSYDDPLHLNGIERDFEIFQNSPAASLNSTGTPPHAGSQGLYPADADDRWQRNQNVILTGFGNMYNPHILHEPGAEYPFLMFFFGWAAADCNPGFPGCDAIFLARGRDLDNWEVYSGADQWDGTGNAALWVPIIAAQEGAAFWDQWHNGDPSVVKKDGFYYMAYSATGFDQDLLPDWDPADTDGDISTVMFARSTDAINWTKSSGPILMYQPEVGQLQDYNSPGYAGGFHRPSLMWDGDRWRCWFDYWAPGPGGVCMGLAECTGDPMDPADWTVLNALDAPLISQWPNPDIVKHNGTYYNYSDTIVYPRGEGWPARQIREATSTDGINWTLGLWVPPDTDTPSLHVPEPFILSQGGQDWLYVFYATQIGGSPIFDFRYDRLRWMRRPIGSTPPARAQRWDTYAK